MLMGEGASKSDVSGIGVDRMLAPDGMPPLQPSWPLGL